MGTQCISRTVYKSGLSSMTLDIIQPDLATPNRNIGRSKSNSTCSNSIWSIHYFSLTGCNSPNVGSPSCLQTTLASVMSHKSSHTVPQILLLHISTRPLMLVPPTSLMSPCVHGGLKQDTPTSSERSQVFVIYTPPMQSSHFLYNPSQKAKFD